MKKQQKDEQLKSSLVKQFEQANERQRQSSGYPKTLQARENIKVVQGDHYSREHHISSFKSACSLLSQTSQGLQLLRNRAFSVQSNASSSNSSVSEMAKTVAEDDQMMTSMRASCRTPINNASTNNHGNLMHQEEEEGDNQQAKHTSLAQQLFADQTIYSSPQGAGQVKLSPSSNHFSNMINNTSLQYKDQESLSLGDSGIDNISYTED